MEKRGRWVRVVDVYGRTESFKTLSYEMDFDTCSVEWTRSGVSMKSFC